MCDQPPSAVDTVVVPLKRLLKEFDLRESEGRREFLGYPFEDFVCLNHLISGIRPSCLTLLATTASNLRAQFLLQMAISIICKSKIPVLFLCFENSPEELLNELLAQKTGLNMEIIRKRKIKSNAKFKESLKRGLESFAKFQSYLNLVGGSQSDTTEQIEQHLLDLKARYKTDRVVLVIDSVQRIPNYNFYSSQSDKVSDILNRLKIIANSGRVAVMAGSEVSLAGELVDLSDNKERLTVEHCHGNSDLARYADVVMTISKSWIDSTELKNMLRLKAEAGDWSIEHLPQLDVVDLYVDKSPQPNSENPAVQFMIFKEAGYVTELGLFSDQVLARQNRIDKALGNLLNAGILQFSSTDSAQKTVSSSSNVRIDSHSDITEAINSDQVAQEKRKIKPSIKLNR